MKASTQKYIEDKTKSCPGCLQEMKQHLIGTGWGGVSTLLVFLCKNENCKFNNVPRLVDDKDVIE